MESIWYKTIENQVIEQNEKLYKKDFKFYQVDTFLKLAKKIDEFSTDCTECKYLKTEIEKVSENLSEYLKGDVVSRRNYEKKLDNISKHTRKVHKIYPKQFNLYNYSFFGLIGGIGLGWATGFLINSEYVFQGIIIGFVVGLISGRIIGKVKDKKLIKEGRILD